MQGFPILSLLTWLPMAGGLLVLAFGDKRIQAGRWLALITSLAVLVASIPLYTHFDSSTHAFQFIERFNWIPAFHADYYFGVDGISLPLILLTTFMTVPIIVAAWTVIEQRPSQYY